MFCKGSKKNVERPNARMPLEILPHRCTELHCTRIDLRKKYLAPAVGFQGHGQSDPNLPSDQGLCRRQMGQHRQLPLDTLYRDVAGINSAVVVIY